MVNVNFIGRLGSDSEIKTAKSGRQFVAMRIATDEFVNGQKTTAWMSVVWSGEHALNMKQWLTKGKLVSVMGTEQIKLYQTRTGEWAADRNVIADRIEFVNTGSGQTQNADAVKVETGTFSNPTPEEKAKLVEAAKQAAATAAPTIPTIPVDNTTTDDDDLPF